ncbi:MAG TPA: hypothetical protein VGQ28_18060, partial [Thermoanaerobaculia bacterium]|nr:hypothetical protein [Thermoanaerobaculia bacterium]
MLVRKPCLRVFALVALAFVVLTAFVSARPAAAHMRPLTDQELAAGSTDVVVAVVESSRSRWNAG